MPTLLDRAAELRQQVAALSQANVERDRFGRLSTRASLVRDAAEELINAKTAARLMALHDVQIGAFGRPSAALRGKPSALRSVLSSDWRAFADDNSLTKTFLEPLGSYSRRIQQAILDAWKAHVDDGLPEVKEGLLATLSNAGFRSQTEKFRQIQREINELRQAPPVSDASFIKLDKLKYELQTVWTELDGIPEPVVRFLNKAALRQATIAELTPEVRDWLGKRAMLEQLRIGLG